MHAASAILISIVYLLHAFFVDREQTGKIDKLLENSRPLAERFELDVGLRYSTFISSSGYHIGFNYSF